MKVDNVEASVIDPKTLDDLERLASAAKLDAGVLSGVNVIGGNPVHMRAFVAAATPVAVLVLIAEAREAARLRERVVELEAMLANERGAGQTPDGWYWADGQWNRETGGGLLVIDRNLCPVDDDATFPWLPTTWTAHWSNWLDEGSPGKREAVAIATRDTARELFIIADEYAAALTPEPR